MFRTHSVDSDIIIVYYFSSIVYTDIPAKESTKKMYGDGVIAVNKDRMILRNGKWK